MMSVKTKVLNFELRYQGFPDGSDGKESACNAGDPSLISELGRSLVEGIGYSFQYSCLENPANRRDWQATQPTGSQRVRHI